VLACCTSNLQLDNLLNYILSTIAKEDEVAFCDSENRDPIQVTRVVAPSREQIHGLSRAARGSLSLIEEALAPYNLANLRREIAVFLSQEHPDTDDQIGVDARLYIALHDELVEYGSLSARRRKGEDPDVNNRRALNRLTKAYNKAIIMNSKIVGTTTFMATCHAVLNSPGFDLVITDKTPAIRDDQLFGAFIFQEQLKLLVCTGDPMQSFLCSRSRSSSAREPLQILPTCATDSIVGSTCKVPS
jgi:hypothetical protein